MSAAEPTGGGEAITDYLNSFNRDLGDGAAAASAVSVSVVGPAGDGPSTSSTAPAAEASGIGQIEGLSEETIQLIAQQAAASGHDGPITAQISSANGETVQTVTLVPDQESGGYMLIVQPNVPGDDDGLLHEGHEGEQGEHAQNNHVFDQELNEPVDVKPVKKTRGGKKKGRGANQNDITVYDFEDHPMAEELDGDHVDIVPVGDADELEASVGPKKKKQKLAQASSLQAASAIISATAVHLTPGLTPKIKKNIIITSPSVGSGAHQCNYCTYTSHKRYLLSRHMKSHSEERPHKCGICERGFKTIASLQNHVNTHTGVRPHQCKHCESSFTTSGELVRHVRYKHTHEKPHHCSECEYSSVELSKLKRHMRCHTGERPYQCPHCTYASPDTYKLKRHLRIHTGEKPYECEMCKARFTQSNSLKAHQQIHNGNKPIFKCNLCPTTCGRKTDLRIHVLKLHTSERPLTCKRCDQTFPDRYQYKTHLKSHEGEKCFKCDLCSYSSVSQRHLESHMLIHTDQKPYQCESCEQSFRQKQLLKRHENLYHNPNYIPPAPKEKTHECQTCGKAFRHKGNLMRHLTLHDPDLASAAHVIQTSGGGLVFARGNDIHQLMEDEEEEDDEDDYSIGHGLAGTQTIVLPSGEIATASSTTTMTADGQHVQFTFDPATQQIIQSDRAGGDAGGSSVLYLQFSDQTGEGVATIASSSAEGEIVTPNDQEVGGEGHHTILLDNGQTMVISETVANALSAAVSGAVSGTLTGSTTTASTSRGRRQIRQQVKQEPEFLIQLQGEDEEAVNSIGETTIGGDGGHHHGQVVEGENGQSYVLVDSNGTYIGQTTTGSNRQQRDAVGVAAPPPPSRVSDDTLVAREQERKAKDLATCFGFADDQDEEEDDVIMQLKARDAQ